MASGFTSRLQKGGAAIDDTRRVVELWDTDLAPRENFRHFSDENLLSKASRSRLDDLLRRIIRPRYVDPGPHVIPALKGLLVDHVAFRNACYYESARADDLLASFAEGPLWDYWLEGRLGLSTEDVLNWFDQLAEQGQAPTWTENVRAKTARGLLSALRDFGILEGSAKSRRKEISPPSMSPRGFAYVAWREHEQGASSRALATSNVWRRWLLEDPLIDDMFLQAARLGVLRVSRAGSAVRVDWLVDSLAEVTGAAA